MKYIHSGGMAHSAFLGEWNSFNAWQILTDRTSEIVCQSYISSLLHFFWKNKNPFTLITIKALM